MEVTIPGKGVVRTLAKGDYFGERDLLYNMPVEQVQVASRARNDPKSGLASPNPSANLSGLVFGCIEAKFCK